MGLHQNLRHHLLVRENVNLASVFITLIASPTPDGVSVLSLVLTSQDMSQSTSAGFGCTLICSTSGPHGRAFPYSSEAYLLSPDSPCAEPLAEILAVWP